MSASTSAATAPSSSSSPTRSGEPVVVHHLQDSRSQRILWLLEELGTPYVIQKYLRVKGLAPPELLQVHPLGKSPVITDHGRTIAESGVIVDYLIQHYGPQLAASSTDEDERLAVAYWSQMAEGSLMGPLVITRVFSTIKTDAPWYVRPIVQRISDAVDSNYLTPTLTSLFNFIEAQLQQQKANGSDFFVTHHLTSADIMLLFPLEAAVSRAPKTMGEATKAWVHRMHQRDAYKRGLEKGGEYAFAKM